MGVYAGPEIASDGLILALDPGNLKSYSYNYHPNPLDIYSWVGPAGGYQQTLSRDTIQSPVGNSPLKIVTSGTSSYTGSYNSLPYNIASASSGQTWTVSFYVKSSVSTTISIFIFESNSSGGYLTYTQPSFNIGTDWTRVSATATFSQATTASIQTRIDCYFSGVTLWVDGYQVERSSSVTDFTSSYTGDNILNVLGSGNNGTLVNGPSYNGSNRGSLVFDGINDHVLTSSVATYGNNTTWEAWVYCTANVSTYNMFMGRYLPYFGFYGGNSLFFSNNISAVQSTIQTATNLSLNTWYHAAFTTSYNGVNTTMKIYTNGSETATGTFSGTQGNYGYKFMIGDGNNGTDGASAWYPFQGRVSSAKVYNRTLTAAEIQQNFNALRGRFGI